MAVSAHRSRCYLLVIVLLSTLYLVAGCSSTPDQPVDNRQVAPKYARSSAATHRVVKGDTLYAIAWKAGVDYRTLAKWNGMRQPYTIYPGKVLRLKPPVKQKKKTSKLQPQLTTATRTKTKPNTKSKTKSKTKKSAPVAAANSLHWRWPTNGRLLSTFKTGDSARSGIRIVGKKGQKIVAAESGQIVYVGGGLIGYGQLIIIKHNNKYLSAYGHNSRLLVKEGQAVKKGKHIADMGSVNSGKAMLHFEIRKYGKPTDPMRLLPVK